MTYESLMNCRIDNLSFEVVGPENPEVVAHCEFCSSREDPLFYVLGEVGGRKSVLCGVLCPVCARFFIGEQALKRREGRDGD
jgi:hypothetical protein